MKLSRRAYALHRGVSEKAVRKAIATGRITLEPDNTIDPVKADRQWEAQTDPVRQTTGRSPGKPVPRVATKAVDDTLDESGPAAPAGAAAFMRARTAREMIGAQTAKVKLQKMKGELVDRDRATALVFRLAREERDAWVTWPARVAALMAAELSASCSEAAGHEVCVETAVMQQVLETHVRAHLEELSEVKVRLG